MGRKPKNMIAVDEHDYEIEDLKQNDVDYGEEGDDNDENDNDARCEV